MPVRKGPQTKGKAAVQTQPATQSGGVFGMLEKQQGVKMDPDKLLRKLQTWNADGTGRSVKQAQGAVGQQKAEARRKYASMQAELSQNVVAPQFAYLL